FNAVKKNDQTLLSSPGTLVRCIENIFESCGGSSRHNADDSLVILRVRQAIELAAIFKAHGNVVLARQLHDFLDARVLAAASDHDAIEGAVGFEGFLYGMDSGDLVHFVFGSASIKGRAKFQGTLMYGLHSCPKSCVSRFIHQQNDAIQITLA